MNMWDRAGPKNKNGKKIFFSYNSWFDKMHVMTRNVMFLDTKSSRSYIFAPQLRKTQKHVISLLLYNMI